MSRVKINKEQFLAYEAVRTSGDVNMWETENVSILSGDVITSVQVLTIIKNYVMLRKEFMPNERN